MNKKINLSDFNLSDPEQLEKVAQMLIERMEKGMTLKEATGVSEATLEEIYSIAYSHYNVGKYKEAGSLFQYLSAISPTTYKYFLGLAACYHQLGLYADAAQGFFIALNLEAENPLPAYYLLDCLQKIHLISEAKEVADYALEICQDKPEFSELKNRIILIKNNLS